jgi:hypothetical protein
MRIPTLLTVAALSLTPAEAAAQVCFRGRPAPACRSFLVSEFLVGAKFRETRYTETAWVGNWEAGLLVNLAGRSAVGGSVLGAITGAGNRLAFKGRYRYWLAPSLALDLGPGVVVVASPGGAEGDLDGPGFTGHAGVMWKDIAGVSLLYEAVPFRNPLDGLEGTESGFGVGARFGAQAGGIGGVLAFAGLVIMGAIIAANTS